MDHISCRMKTKSFQTLEVLLRCYYLSSISKIDSVYRDCCAADHETHLYSSAMFCPSMLSRVSVTYVSPKIRTIQFIQSSVCLLVVSFTSNTSDRRRCKQIMLEDDGVQLERLFRILLKLKAEDDCPWYCPKFVSTTPLPIKSRGSSPTFSQN